MAYTTEDDLIAAVRGGEARYRQLSGDAEGSTTNSDAAHEKAQDEMESLLRGRYTVPIEGDLPPALKDAFIDLQLWYLAKASDRMPEFINTNAAIAREYIKKLGTGKASLIVDSTSTGQQTGDDVFVELPSSNFDAHSASSELMQRKPPL